MVSYRELLNPTEKEEKLRFHFARDRHRHHPFQMGGWFHGLLVRYRCGLSSCLPP